MTQRGRNMYECVTIVDKTLFMHLLVIGVFVFGYVLFSYVVSRGVLVQY
jgi:hypothetical protein